MRRQGSDRSSRESSGELSKRWLEEAACREESGTTQLRAQCRLWRKVGQGDPGQTRRLIYYNWASTAADFKQRVKKTALTRCGGQTGKPAGKEISQEAVLTVQM